MIKKIFCFLVVVILPGCFHVQTHKEYSQLKSRAQNLLDEPVEHGIPHQYSLDQMPNVEIKNGLSRDNAVTIALRNNPELRAEFENLGIAKADLEQAGLFNNPSVEGIFALPKKNNLDNNVTNLIDVYATMRISDLWVVPLSKHVAEDVLEIVSLQILSKILDTVAETKKTFNECLYVDLQLNNTNNLLKTTKLLRDEIYYQQQYGYTSKYDQSLIDSKVAHAQADIIETEQTQLLAHLKLKELLGINPDDGLLQVSGDLAIESPVPTCEEIQEYAINHRPEILIANMKIEQYKDLIRLEKAKIFNNVNFGFSFQQDFGTTKGWGPAFILDVPAFDSNYAQIAKAEFLQAQSYEMLTAAKVKIKTEIMQAFRSLTYFREELRVYEQNLLPPLQNAIDYAYRFVETMQINVIDALQAEITYYEENQKKIELQLQANQALVNLERATGRKLILINKLAHNQTKPDCNFQE